MIKYQSFAVDLPLDWPNRYNIYQQPIKNPMKQALLLFIAILLVSSTLSWRSIRRLNIRNQCSKTLWIGVFAIPQPVTTGFEMPPGTDYVLPLVANTVSGRLWARTDCKWIGDKFTCTTGDCGTPLNNFGVECKGITGQAPATLVEFTMSNSGFSDFYDLSNVDGFNVPVYFGPTPGTYQRVDNPDLGKFNCGSAGCSLSTEKCPRELQVKGQNGSIYCLSICAAVYNAQQVEQNKDILGPIAADDMKRDLVCCACGAGTGGCLDPNSHYCCSPLDPRSGIGGRCYVETWPKPSQNFDRYDKVFKDQCPEAYSWQFDDISSTYQCLDGDYDVVFCP